MPQKVFFSCKVFILRFFFWESNPPLFLLHSCQRTEGISEDLLICSLPLGANYNLINFKP